jgi:RHS repeat-associated protein
VTYTNFGGQIVSEDRGGTKRDYVSDTLGSTIALMDDNGDVTDTWEYWPYGEVASHTGDSETPFTFVGTLGYFKDLVSSLTYVRTRFYQAFTGQWMTLDPIWPSEQPYAYALGNAVSFVDPLGLQAKICRDCPSIMDVVWSTLNIQMFDLWARAFTNPDIVKRINGCIQNSARSWGVTCDPFTWDTLTCLKDNSMWVPVLCSDCSACGSNRCACAPRDEPKRIYICWPAAGLPGCGNYGVPGNRTSVNLWISLLHELLHTCGFGHGTTTGGDPPPTRNTCNEIAVCCIRKVIQGGDTNKCRRP